MNSVLFTHKLKSGKSIEEIQKDVRFLEIRFSSIDASKHPLQKYYAEKELGEAYLLLMNKTTEK